MAVWQYPSSKSNGEENFEHFGMRSHEVAIPLCKLKKESQIKGRLMLKMNFNQ